MPPYQFAVLLDDLLGFDRLTKICGDLSQELRASPVLCAQLRDDLLHLG